MAEDSHGKRTALLIRCTADEAERIRQAAQQERRTISGYVLNALMQRMAVQDKTRRHFQEAFGRPLNEDKPPSRKAKPKVKKQVAGNGQQN